MTTSLGSSSSMSSCDLVAASTTTTIPPLRSSTVTVYSHETSSASPIQSIAKDMLYKFANFLDVDDFFFLKQTCRMLKKLSIKRARKYDQSCNVGEIYQECRSKKVSNLPLALTEAMCALPFPARCLMIPNADRLNWSHLRGIFQNTFSDVRIFKLEVPSSFSRDISLADISKEMMTAMTELFSTFPKLREFHLHVDLSNPCFNSKHVEAFLNAAIRANTLKKLTLSGSFPFLNSTIVSQLNNAQWSCLEEIHLDLILEDFNFYWASHLQKLTSLKANFSKDGCRNYKTTIFSLHRCVNLRYLSIQNVAPFTSNEGGKIKLLPNTSFMSNFGELLARLPSLKALDIKHSAGIDSSIAFQAFPFAPNLREIELCHVFNLDRVTNRLNLSDFNILPEDLHQLSSCHALQVLTVAGNCYDADGLNALLETLCLVKKPPRLQDLYILFSSANSSLIESCGTNLAKLREGWPDVKIIIKQMEHQENEIE